MLYTILIALLNGLCNDDKNLNISYKLGLIKILNTFIKVRFKQTKFSD